MMRCIHLRIRKYLALVAAVFVAASCAHNPSMSDAQAASGPVTSKMSIQEYLDRIATNKSAYAAYNLVPTSFTETPGTRDPAWLQYEAEPFLTRDGARIHDIRATIGTNGKLRRVQFSIDANPCISTKALANRMGAGPGWTRGHPPSGDSPPVYPPPAFRWRDEYNTIQMAATSLQDDCLDFISLTVNNNLESSGYRSSMEERKLAEDGTAAGPAVRKP